MKKFKVYRKSYSGGEFVSEYHITIKANYFLIDQNSHLLFYSTEESQNGTLVAAFTDWIDVVERSSEDIDWDYARSQQSVARTSNVFSSSTPYVTTGNVTWQPNDISPETSEGW